MSTGIPLRHLRERHCLCGAGLRGIEDGCDGVPRRGIVADDATWTFAGGWQSGKIDASYPLRFARHETKKPRSGHPGGAFLIPADAKPPQLDAKGPQVLTEGLFVQRSIIVNLYAKNPAITGFQKHLR